MNYQFAQDIWPPHILSRAYMYAPRASVSNLSLLLLLLSPLCSLNSIHMGQVCRFHPVFLKDKYIIKDDDHMDMDLSPFIYFFSLPLIDQINRLWYL